MSHTDYVQLNRTFISDGKTFRNKGTILQAHVLNNSYTPIYVFDLSIMYSINPTTKCCLEARTHAIKIITLFWEIRGPTIVDFSESKIAGRYVNVGDT